MTLRSAIVLLAGLAMPAAGCLSRPDPVPQKHLDVPLRQVAMQIAVLEAHALLTSPETRSLHLERVTSAAHLQEAVVWRDGDYVCGFYDDVSWLERPAHLLQRALERELFGARGFRRSEGRADLRAQVELVAFDERLAPSREAWVQVILRHGLSDLDTRQQTIEASTPIADDSPEALADAMTTSCAEVVRAVVAAIAAD